MVERFVCSKYKYKHTGRLIRYTDMVLPYCSSFKHMPTDCCQWKNGLLLALH